MTKRFVEVGYVKQWPDYTGKLCLEVTAPATHLPPGTKLFVLSDTLDPQVSGGGSAEPCKAASCQGCGSEPHVCCTPT